MKIFVDTADLGEIDEYRDHPWVSGFTTNPTLMAGVTDAWAWAKELVAMTDKPISIDGPPEVLDLAPNVWRKILCSEWGGTVRERENLTAVCSEQQARSLQCEHPYGIISVFAGRIMDTGRDPIPVLDAAKRTGAQVLWASVREPYNICMAEDAGCDIVTVPPAILRKWLAWQGKPLETVATETITQFEKDAEGLW